MKIKDLPKELKKLALINQDKQNGKCDENQSLNESFICNDTPEGHNFWSDIEKGIYINELEKPTQYKIGIDTFERAKANLTKEELLACCRFNIDKYTWRKKDQDKSDFEKIIAYATYAIENGF